mmetsp:Transcript_31016/g.54802  ORF Transcript_31016/g.54802 Transcript_31016/m.54802 type:complete len:124 (+) Transcript_31016:3801-4172(+)
MVPLPAPCLFCSGPGWGPWNANFNIFIDLSAGKQLIGAMRMNHFRSQLEDFDAVELARLSCELSVVDGLGVNIAKLLTLPSDVPGREGTMSSGSGAFKVEDVPASTGRCVLARGRIAGRDACL